MKKHFKSILISVLWYLAIQIISCVAFNKPGTSIIAKPVDAILLCAFVGPFMWIPYLIYPSVFLILTYSIQMRRKIEISSSLISSSIILYGIALPLANYVFEFFKKGTDPWKFILIAAISCSLGFFYSKYKTPNQANAAEAKNRAAD